MKIDNGLIRNLLYTRYAVAYDGQDTLVGRRSVAGLRGQKCARRRIQLSGKKSAAFLSVVMLAAVACSGTTTSPSVAPTTAASSTAPSVAPSSSASEPAPSASESQFTYVDGKLQPLADGFPNHALSLLNGDEAGSDDGIYARNMQAILSKYAPVPVEVLDRPGASYGMFTMAQFMQESQAGKDGYMPSVTAFIGGSLDVLTTPIERDLGLTLADINPVAATELVPWLVIMRADAPWQTFEEMVAFGKANPNTVKYTLTSGSGTSIATLSLIKQLGLTVKTIVQSGGSTVTATAVAAGAADFTTSVAAIAKVHADAGKVRIVLAFGDKKLNAPYDKIPNTKDIGIPNLPWGTIRGFVVGKETPDLHRAWLAELFGKAAADPAYAQRLTTIPGATATTMDHDQLVAAMNKTIADSEPIIRDLGLAWDQQ